MSGLADLLQTFRRLNLIVYLAWSDVRARYKRSVLGPFWITLSTAIGVVGMGFLWSELFKMDRAEFIPLLTIGLILWQFMSACITESATIFNRQGNIIRNLTLPLAIHPAQLVLRHAINFAHNLPLLFLVFVLVGKGVGLYGLMALPGLLLVILNLFWIALLFGMLGARFRDFEYIVGMVMPLLMFLSPVMYRPSSLTTLSKYMWINPLAEMIEVVRDPLLGDVVPLPVYLANIAILLVGGSITLWMFNAKRNRIAFWV
jgi:lipopolysaccharide transport system permease protein